MEGFGDRLELTLKEIDLLPSGSKLWQPGRNRPLERVDIAPEMQARGFMPVGKITIGKAGGTNTFSNPRGYFLKKFETSEEERFPVFRKQYRPMPRINLDGSVEK